MATERTNVTTVMKMMVAVGTTASGTIRYAARTFSSVNPEISDEDLLAIGQELGALQANEVGDVMRSELATLITTG